MNTSFEARLAVGTRLGTYRIGEQLGEPGGQGTVYRAWCEPVGYVAIKVIHPGLYQLHRDQFDKEVALLARVTDAFVVRLLDVVDVVGTDQLPATKALVMELADGSLADAIGATGAPPGILVTVFRSAARGLLAIHRAGSTHNDVKPPNLLRFGNEWKVADLGISTPLERTHAYQLWADGLYAAPERRHRGEVRPEGDVWALGVTLHEAVTGELPFSDLRHPLNPALRQPWRSLVTNCLEPRPADRIRLDEFVARLPAERTRTKTAPHSLPSDVHTVNGTRCPTARRRHRARAPLLIALVAVILAGAVWTATGGWNLRWNPFREHTSPPKRSAGGAASPAAGPATSRTPSSAVTTTPPTSTPSPQRIALRVVRLSLCNCWDRYVEVKMNVEARNLEGPYFPVDFSNHGTFRLLLGPRGRSSTLTSTWVHPATDQAESYGAFLGGGPVVGLAANPPATNVSGTDYYTYWRRTGLSPDETYLDEQDIPTQFGPRGSDLVFNVPPDEELNILGVGVFAPNSDSLVGFASFSDQKYNADPRTY